MDDHRYAVRGRLAAWREWIDHRPPGRFALVLVACFVIGITVIICSAYLSWLYGLDEGDRVSETVVASATVTVLDTVATEKLKSHVAELVSPVYTADTRASTEAAAELEAFLDSISQARSAVAAGEAEEEAVARLGAEAPDTVSDDTLRYLLTVDTILFGSVSRQALGTLQPVFAEPIMEESLSTARHRLKSIVETLGMSGKRSTVVEEVASGFIRPNQMIDEEQTLVRRQVAMAQVAPVAITVPKDKVVIRQGEIVTAQDLLILNALGMSKTRSGWSVWAGVFLIALLEGAVFFLLLRRFNKATGMTNNMLLVLVTLMLGAVAISRLFILHPLSPYLIPAAGMGMVVAIILNARSGFLMVALLGLNIGLITDFQMRYALAATIVGALAVYLVSRVVQRAALLGAAVVVMVIAALTCFSVELFREAGIGSALTAAVWGLGHGLLAWVVTVLLLLLMDLVFNLNTPLRLLELADPAQPLLKRLLQVAPGTYNHSIMMGNLAEAAAEAIGADPLLARVGAYYHDIGKTVRPEYFVENQIYVSNPHDRLSPNLSRLAIAAHVRDGEHLARLHGLPTPVVDIIRQHHGTSVMAFFYHKAQEASDTPVDEEDFRYEEERPHSKEAAIIMLADGTEAAARAMADPTRRKIKGVIEEVFRQRMEDGQLDESELTLGDIHKIKEAFDVGLRGLMGHRIRYPEANGRQERGPQAASRTRVPPSAAKLHDRQSTERGSSSGGRR